MRAGFPDFETLLSDEAVRREAFPVVTEGVFLGHAGVTALPAAVAEAIIAFTRQSSTHHQEFGGILRDIREARVAAAKLIGADPDEIALLGPTSLGLSLFANGLPWEAGDEIICYADDYPANVYPWLELERHGVRLRQLQPERPGEITVELVESALTERTRLVALASCHFQSGYRIDVDAIGAMLGRRGVLFSVDAIQTIGAFPLSVRHIDFLSADAHKWMLGPVAMGIVFVKRARFEQLRPTLLGAWNIQSPNFIAQSEIKFVETAQRYEPGVLNLPGMHGMRVAHEMFLHYGMERIAARLLLLKRHFVAGLRSLDFEIYGPTEDAVSTSITTCFHPKAEMASLFKQLEAAGVTASLRHNRAGRELIRFSPHFYNTEAELEHVLTTLRAAL